MLLVVAWADMAERLSHILSGARYVLQIDGENQEEAGRELRHQVHRFQPDVLLIDWRLGGSKWRAVDEIGAIISRTESHPHVIALLPWTTSKVKAAAAEAGCFDAINALGEDFDQDVMEAVEAALLDRQRERPEPRRVSRADLH